MLIALPDEVVFQKTGQASRWRFYSGSREVGQIILITKKEEKNGRDEFKKKFTLKTKRFIPAHTSAAKRGIRYTRSYKYFLVWLSCYPQSHLVVCDLVEKLSSRRPR